MSGSACSSAIIGRRQRPSLLSRPPSIVDDAAANAIPDFAGAVDGDQHVVRVDLGLARWPRQGRRCRCGKS